MNLDNMILLLKKKKEIFSYIGDGDRLEAGVYKHWIPMLLQ